MRPWWLLALSYIGALTHPYLDLLTTYSVQLFSPFSKSWYHADGLFIIDIWIWLILAVSIFASRRRERAGREWRRLPRAAIALVVVYIGANLLITERSNAAVREYRPDARSIFASPPPFFSWRRDIVWREDHCYSRASYDAFGAGFVAADGCAPTNMDNPLVRQAIRSDPGLRKYLKWSVLPHADVARGKCAIRVTIGDARYGKGRRSPLVRESVIPNPRGCLDNLEPRS
jgi:inner membrane protein